MNTQPAQQQPRPVWRRSWFSSIGVFVISQILFIIFERTGWNPGYREITSKLINQILDSTWFQKWFTFYEEPFANLITLLFLVTCFIPGIIGLLIDVLKKA